MLGDEQRKTIILFTDAIAALCAPSQLSKASKASKRCIGTVGERLSVISTGKVTVQVSKIHRVMGSTPAGN